jgi:DNA-binding GntR family transcriptional regulator
MSAISAGVDSGLKGEPGADGGFSLPPGRALAICLALQKAILEHRLRPGMKLSEDEVGDIFGASRTVVRAALHALAHSGLVTMERNRGAFVSRPSIREAHEVFEARALIEPRVVRRAAQAVTAAQLDGLRAHIAAEHAALAASEMGKALSLSGQFHIAVSDIADQQVLSAIIRQLISRSSLIIALYWKRPDTACESHSHDALLAALQAKDGQAAEEIMKSHLVDLHSGLDLTERTHRDLTLAEVFRA